MSRDRKDLEIGGLGILYPSVLEKFEIRYPHPCGRMMMSSLVSLYWGEAQVKVGGRDHSVYFGSLVRKKWGKGLSRRDEKLKKQCGERSDMGQAPRSGLELTFDYAVHKAVKKESGLTFTR